jgi:Xaa-Pro aminopeptidase
MRYQPIDPLLFRQNRERLYPLLKPNALVLLNANDIMPTNADGSMGFKQNSDLFYLSGIDQEETVLLLYPDCPNPKFREVLFVRETNEHIATWEGYKYTKTHASQVSGIEKVLWLSQLDRILNSLVFEAEHLYLNTNEYPTGLVLPQSREERFVHQMQQRYPLHRYERLAPLMHRLRAIKQAHEITLLQEACRITKLGFERVARFVKPGVMEYEVEAELAHEFIRNRSEGFAYQPIIASGANACVLHYVANNQPCHDGDLLLLDVAANYANYNADLTRTIPVNGRFTPRQRAVYEAVLRTFKFATSLLRPGTLHEEYHQEVGRYVEKELLALGLLRSHDIAQQDPDWPAYKKYLMHGVSHQLGLDVHDVGSKYRPFEAGMVFTCEPGLYIKAEGMGIRLENDILITEQGPVDLMAHIPLEIDEIEDLMNQ